MRFIISQKEQLKQIIEHYGDRSQKEMLFEEMAELQKEVCKELRGKGNIQHIAEELADVLEVQKKIERTLDRIEGECNVSD